MENHYVDSIMDAIPLCVVVDATDVYDKSSSETTFGNQKSLAFAAAWMRSVPRRPLTSLRWTATENMLVDGGTKLMDMKHLRDTPSRGRCMVNQIPYGVHQGQVKEDQGERCTVPD